MIKVNFENISIKKLGTSSGLFMGNVNTIKSFRNNQEKNEVLGNLSGDDNRLVNNTWDHTKSGDKE